MGGLPVSRREITSDNSVCVAKVLALTLLAITQDCELRDIFNDDGTSLRLFYYMAPDTMFAFTGEECHGTKQNKDRLTDALRKHG